MKWKKHDKWANKLGISNEVSRYVNNLIDAIRDDKTLPPEYIDFVRKESEKIGEQSKKGKRVIAMLIQRETLKHDSGRRRKTIGRVSAKIQSRYMKKKGKDYVKAWYLHHALDYLEGNRDWIRNVPSETVETVIMKHKKNRPQTFSKEIADFLKNNTKELEQDLKL